MAKIILSALVTEITGSIGGTTFRRTPRGTVGYNKQSRLLTSSIANNKQRLAIGNVFQTWNTVDSAVKRAWADVAAQFPQTDRFGKQYFLTGRQLFVKCLSQSLVVPGIVPDPNNFETDIAFINAEYVGSDIGSEEVFIDISGITVATKVTLGVRPKIKTKPVKPHSHFRVIENYTVASDGNINIYDALINEFGSVDIGQNYEVHLYSINNSGLTSPVVALGIELQ